MRSIKGLIVFLLLSRALFSSAQSDRIKVSINLNISNNELILSDTTGQMNENTSFQIDVLKFYLSNFRFYKNDTLVFQEHNSFHLFDEAIPTTHHFIMENSENTTYNKVVFNLGIDSITNVSGALGGALDPTNGMYWTWQSGYVNFKLEGRSNKSNTRNHEVQFHLGGYASPNNSLQTITFNVKNLRDIKLVLDADNIFNNIDLTTQNHIMSPCKEAIKLSKIVAQSFSCNQ